MLKLIHSMDTLPFRKVAQIYTAYQPGMDGFHAEQDFYAYLKEDFFPNKGVYALWDEDGEYKAAVRLVPWKDGVLLAGLETKLQQRKRGYAKALLLAVAEYLAAQQVHMIYSHVDKNNVASVAVHKACGYTILSEQAHFLDGSVLSSHYTVGLHL